MKKFIFLVAIAAIVVASCTKDSLSEEEKEVKAGMIHYKAAVKFDATRSTINGEKIVWEKGDKVAIFDGINTEPNEFTVTGVNEGGAWIEGEISELAEKIYGVYPYSAAVGLTLSSEDSLTVKLPSVQTIESGRVIASDALVTVSEEADPYGGYLLFYNPFSVLKFTVPVDGVKKVVFSGLDGKGVTGEETIRADDQGNRKIVVKGESSLTVSKADGFAKNTEYYATVLSRDVQGVRFVFTTDDYKANVESANLASFVKNCGLTFNFTETQIENGKFPFNIYNKEDLDAFAANADLYEAGEWVNLVDDIDYEGGDWTTTGDFAGNFDGNGHYIKGINCSDSTSNCSFISTLQYPASVTGLTIKDSKFNSTCALSANVSAVVGTLVGGTVTGCNLVNCEITSTGDNVGGVVGLLQYGDIENCSVDDKTAITGKYSVGSIVGCRKLNTEGKETNLKSCTSSASLTATGGYSSKSGVGGIAGSYNRTIPGNDNITGCEFSGTINTQLHAAGGIIGWIRGGADVEIHISQCKSTPAAMNVATTSKYIGGIVGYFEGVYGKLTAVDISECNSTCDISAGQNVGGIVGHVEKTYAPLSITSCTASGKLVASISGAGGIIGALVTAYTNATAGSATIDKCISYADASSVYGVSGICSYASVATGTVMTIRNSEYLGKTLEATGCNTKTYLAYNGGIVGWALVSSKATLNIFNDVSRVETIKYSSAAKSVGVGGILGAADSNGDVYISGCYSTIIKKNILCDGVKTKATSNYGGIFGVRVSGKLYLDYCYVDSSLKTDIGASKYLGTSASNTTNSGTYSSAADCLTKMNAYVTAAEDETLLSWEKGTTDDFPVHVGMTTK